MTLSFTEFFKGCGGYFPFPERKVAIFMEKIFQALICTTSPFFFGLDFLKLLTHRVSGPLPLDLQLLKSLSLSFLLLQSCLLIMMDGVFKSFRAFRLQKQVQSKYILYFFLHGFLITQNPISENRTITSLLPSSMAKIAIQGNRIRTIWLKG